MIVRLLFFLLAASILRGEDIRWLVNYGGKSMPAAPWAAVGKPNAKLEADGLRLIDDGKEFAHYRAAWKANPDEEIIVEATIKAGAITGSQPKKPATSLWPWRDGAPVMVQVSDGQHQDGFVIFPAQATSFTDRFVPIDTTNRLPTSRLIFRGTDQDVWAVGPQQL